jgi:hypothetical protein
MRCSPANRCLIFSPCRRASQTRRLNAFNLIVKEQTSARAFRRCVGPKRDDYHCRLRSSISSRRLTASACAFSPALMRWRIDSA